LINRADITIVTDQDKGRTGAIKEVLPSVGHFFCSWHRRMNIVKMCGASIGRVPYSALWVYNKLVECRSVEHFDKLRDRYFPQMNRKDLQYLNSVPNALQYAVKRCEQGAYMFHRTTSQGSEVMNAANIDMRSAIAVCPHRKDKDGMLSLQNATNKRMINYRDFMINIVECGNEEWECSVTRRLVNTAQKNTVIIPKVPPKG